MQIAGFVLPMLFSCQVVTSLSQQRQMAIADRCIVQFTRCKQYSYTISTLDDEPLIVALSSPNYTIDLAPLNEARGTNQVNFAPSSTARSQVHLHAKNYTVGYSGNFTRRLR